MFHDTDPTVEESELEKAINSSNLSKRQPSYWTSFGLAFWNFYALNVIPYAALNEWTILTRPSIATRRLWRLTYPGTL